MSWGLGGDELAGVRVDVVEVVVVVVVVVGGCGVPASVGCRGGCTSPAARPAAGAPRPLPPPFVPSSPLGSLAPSRLSLGARGALALALGPLSSPLPVSRVPPPVPHALARPLSHLPPPGPLHLGALPVPLRALPVPWPLSGPLPRVVPSAACALLSPAAAPFLDHSPGVPLPLQLRQRDAWRRALARRGADVLLPPRGEGLGGERLGGAGVGVGGVGVGAVLRALRAHCCCCSGRQRGVRGPCGVLPSLARRAGGRGVAGRGGVAARRVCGRSPWRALLALFRCCGGRRRGPVARAGSAPRFRGVLGAAAWSAEAVVRLAGAAVATPRAPSSFSSAAAAAAGEAPVARAGSVPHVRGVLGAAAWPAEAVSRPAGVAAAAPRAPSSLSFAAVAAADEAPVARAGSAPRFRGVLGAAAWSAEAVVRPAGAAVAIPRAPFLLSSAAAAALGDAPGSCAGAAPVSAACPGPRSGPRRGSLGLRSPLPARLGPSLGAGRRGWLLGRRRWSSRLAQAPGPAAAARPAPPPPPVSAPRAPRGSPPSTPGRRRGSGSGTGGGGGRPAGGTHRSL